jgi:ElaB/YqjD/DUF883 family membrane-anchored ribosome-binding protein
MSETKTTTTDRTATEDGFKGDVQRLGRSVGQLHDDLSGIARTAGEAAQSGVAAVKAGGRNAAGVAKAKGEEATASFRDSVGRHPGAALGIAIGVGILIGLVGPAILRSRRRAS